MSGIKARRGVASAATALVVVAVAVLAAAGPAQAAAYHARIAGPDRYATSAQISRAGHPTGASTVYLANGEDFPDALASGAAAGSSGAPVLLAKPNAIPDSVQAELRRLAPQQILLIGGEGALSATVESQAAGIAAVGRISGTDRYGTAAELSRRVFPTASTVYVASGVAFPDALSAAASAGHRDAPVLLTAPDRLPDATRAELLRLNPSRVVVAGGSAAVSEDVLSAIRTISSAVRVEGNDRYATSVAIARDAFGSASAVFLASGTRFPDALSGAALAALREAPVILVPSSGGVPASVCGGLLSLAPTTVTALGGDAAISDAVLRDAALGCPAPAPGDRCTASGAEGMDAAAANGAAAAIVAAVRSVDQQIPVGYGLGAPMADLRVAVRDLDAAGVPDRCQDLIGLVEADLDQSIYDSSIFDRSVASYRIARANLVPLLGMVNAALGSSYALP